MKRCPECGFRADDQMCPLCGVRMRVLPDAAQSLRTHVHRQTGETCTLPNQERRKQFVPPASSGKTRKKNSKPLNSKLVQTILVIIIVLLFRSCAQ